MMSANQQASPRKILKAKRRTDENKGGCNLKEEHTQTNFANDTLQSNTSAGISRLAGRMEAVERKLKTYPLQLESLVTVKMNKLQKQLEEMQQETNLRLDGLEVDFEIIKDKIYTSQTQTSTQSRNFNIDKSSEMPSKKLKLIKAPSPCPHGTYTSASQFAKHNKGGKRAINATTGPKDGKEALKELMEKGNFPNVKTALLDWCQKVVDTEIKTFGSKYWKDGSALCALFYCCCYPQVLKDFPQFDEIMEQDDTTKFEVAKLIADKLNIRLNVGLPKIRQKGRCEIKDFLPVVRAIYIGLSESESCNVSML